VDSKKALIAIPALLLAGALGFMVFGGDDAASVVEWNEQDEVVVLEDEFAGDELQGDEEDGNVQRSEFQGEDGNPDSDEPRPLITIKGRVVNKRSDPIEGATVSLSAQGRGRRNRIAPKDVITKSDGTFAFSGKGFTRMWVTLSVAHNEYALASAFKNFDEAKGELDMGDIKVFVGGTIIGSVTDMQGNVISNAEARLSSMDRRNRWRRGGGGGGDLPTVSANTSGAFKIEHITPGRYRVNATAPHRQRQSEGPVTVIDEQTERIAAIQLGPGFELTGIVFRPTGQPLENAEVSIRGADRRSREQDQHTNKRGEFAFDHLKPGDYSVRVRAKGYLTNNEHQGIKVTKSPPLTITMESGLRIEGVVVDAATSAPVTSYGIRVQRVGGLPDPKADRRRDETRKAWEEIRALREKKDLTPEEEKQVRERMTKLTEQMRDGSGFSGFGRDRGGRGGRDGGGRGGSDGGGRGGGDGGGRGSRDGSSRRGRDGDSGRRGRGGFSGFGRSRNTNLPGDTGDVEERPGGLFSFPGLEEGIYVIDVGSPDHQKLRSPRIELHKGGASPSLNLVVQRGLLVQGSVLSKTDRAPLRNANVELRLITEESTDNNRASSRNGGRGQRDMFRQFRGDGPRTTRVLSTRTKRDGTFEIKNAPPGKYVVRAEADGYTPVNTDPFELKAAQISLAMELGALGILHGRVSGIPPDKISEARVMAYAGMRMYRNGEVNPDGTYEITGLEPGGYIVKAFMGDARRYMMRQIFRTMGSQDPNAPEPDVDVEVREGGKHRFNVTVTQNTTGSVKGQVLVNGESATGYRVSLRKIDDGSQEEPRSFFGRFGRGSSSSVDQNGNYEIQDVEMGQYTLTVSPSSGRSRGRGGSSSGNEFTKLTVYVRPEQVTKAPRIAFNVGSLSGTITIPVEDDEKTTRATPVPADARSYRGGRVTLYKDVTIVPDPMQPGGEDVLRFSARSRDGKFEFTTLPTGNYLLQLRLSGRDATTKTIYVGAGESTKVELTAGKIRQPKPKAGVGPKGTGVNPGAKGGAKGATKGAAKGPGSGR